MKLGTEEKEIIQQMCDIIKQLDSQSKTILLSVGSCMLAYQQIRDNKKAS